MHFCEENRKIQIVWLVTSNEYLQYIFVELVHVFCALAYRVSRIG